MVGAADGWYSVGATDVDGVAVGSPAPPYAGGMKPVQSKSSGLASLAACFARRRALRASAFKKAAVTSTEKSAAVASFLLWVGTRGRGGGVSPSVGGTFVDTV